VFVKCSKDKGATWTDLAGKPGAFTITDQNFGGFDVCIDAADTLTVAFAARNKLDLTILTRAEGSWTLAEPKTLDSTIRVNNPSLCKDAAGNVWVAYYHGGHEGMQGVRVSRTPSSEKFGENTGKFNIAWGFYTSFQKIVIWRGQPVIIYSGGTPWESLQLYCSTFDGKHWSIPQADIGACQRAAGSFDVVVDDHDNLWLAWMTFPGLQHIRVRKCNASGKWDTEVIELAGRGRYTAPEIVTDGTEIRVLYGRRVNGELVVTRISADGPQKPTVMKSDLSLARLVSAGRIEPGAKSLPLVWTPPTEDRRTPATEMRFKSLALGAD
jgi:hypothetical protein